MPRRLILPDSAISANAGADGRMYAPSAQRNAPHIAELLAHHAPASGKMLEIASGTGEHAVHFATALPHLHWQPSEIDPTRRTSITAHSAAASLPNLAPVIELDATAPGWGATHAGQDMILLVNLLHLVSTPEAKILIREVGQALSPQGRFVLYGPFLRDGETTSDGDRQFDASLRAQYPEIGYKDDWDVIDWIHGSGMDLVQVIEMPANNLAFVAQRPVL